jgi:hypothetical protein
MGGVASWSIFGPFYVERVTLTGGGPRSLCLIQEACQFLVGEKANVNQWFDGYDEKLGIKKLL